MVAIQPPHCNIRSKQTETFYESVNPLRPSRWMGSDVSEVFEFR